MWGEWIPVGIPPTEGTFYLLYFRDGTMDVGQLVGGMWQAQDGLDFNYGASDMDITHYMVLPPAPVGR